MVGVGRMCWSYMLVVVCGSGGGTWWWWVVVCVGGGGWRWWVADVVRGVISIVKTFIFLVPLILGVYP